ncbi:MAG TPA: SPOR domain-containing protein [Candidatus Obscuribacterales bacterium]
MSVYSIVIQKKTNRLTKLIGKIPLFSSLILWGGMVSPVLAQERYGVYVNGESPFLLEVVQQIQPGAMLQRYNNRNIIDLGIYFNQNQAQKLIQDLRQQGVQGEIINLKPGENLNSPVQVNPMVIPPDQTDIKVIRTSIPPGQIPITTDLGLYQVYVSPTTNSLSAVRQISPNAQTSTYQGQLIIQAGSFVNQSNADQLRQKLSLAGISSTIINSTAQLQTFLASIPNIPPTTLPSFPGSGLGLGNTDSYFILIPSPRNQLVSVAENIVALGVPSQSIQMQQATSNPFVAVGPFVNQQLAQQWETYLQSSGLSRAIVYFGR